MNYSSRIESHSESKIHNSEILIQNNEEKNGKKGEDDLSRADASTYIADANWCETSTSPSPSSSARNPPAPWARDRQGKRANELWVIAESSRSDFQSRSAHGGVRRATAPGKGQHVDPVPNVVFFLREILSYTTCAMKKKKTPHNLIGNWTRFSIYI